jgi:predicted secreted protein
VVPGTPESAPARPRLIRVAVLNTIVATIVFALVWIALVHDLVPIGELPGLGR